MRMNFLDILAGLLVVLGGINWGLIGFFDYNLVKEVFGTDTAVTTILYDAIGIAAIYLLYTFMKLNRLDRQKRTVP